MSINGGGSTQLSLTYAFLPTPNPILASAGGANPNTIDLQIIVSNPHGSTSLLSEIDIDIPVGTDDGAHLSVIKTLPTPPDDPASSWTISVSGEILTITPRSGDALAVTSAIVFTLSGIQVGTHQGTVQIAITEYQSPSGDQAYDDSTYSVVKQPAGSQITSFSATPSTLTDIDGSTTLHWTCSDEGQGLAYAISIASVGGVSVPKDTLHPGSSVPSVHPPTPAVPRAAGNDGYYTCQQGQTGVTYSQISQTTTFELDGLQTDDTGKLVTVASAQTTVLVTTPAILDNSKVLGSPSGRFVWLYWDTVNARGCTLQIDNNPLIDNLPPNTYQNGYLLTFLGAPQPHSLSLTALPIIGRAIKQNVFDAPPMTGPITISGLDRADAAAITPNGSLCLVACNTEDSIAVIDVTARQVESNQIRVGAAPSSIAITPNGLTALVVNGNDATVSVIDVPARKVTRTLPVPGADVLNISPDGTVALISNLAEDGSSSGLYVLEMATMTLKSPMIPLRSTVSGIAFSPDSSTAYVTDSDHNAVAVIDVAALRVRPARIPVGAYPIGIAVTLDGSTAVVANTGDGTVSVIDLATHGVGAPIRTGQAPQSVAVTPDGGYALIANSASSDLTVLELATLTTQTVAVGAAPMTVVVSQFGPDPSTEDPGGPCVLVVNENGTAMLL